MVPPRLWNIVVHDHGDKTFTVRVWVDGKLLRPDCVACSVENALAYVEEALVDVHDGDQLEVRTQGDGDTSTFRAADAVTIIRWLEEHWRASP